MSAQPIREEEAPLLEAVESPGRRLRIARQAKGLTHGDVAAQLHLSVAIVKALENDDHDRLAGPVFVRGYIRNYARLLGLDDRQVLGEIDTPDIDPPSQPLPVGKGVRPELHSSHFGVRLVSWVIVLALITLLVLWWRGRPAPEPVDAEQAVEDPLPVASAEDGSLALPQAGHGMDFVPPADAASESDMPTAAAPPDDSLTEPAPTEAPPTRDPALEEAPIAVGAQTPAPVETPRSATPEAAPALPEDTSEDVAAEQIAAAPNGQVMFEFSGPCWVDIRDSTRKFKIFGEMTKGDSRVLEGVPPYSVILGNSPMVRITVNGQPYDLAPHARGSVARFTLDPSNPNR